MSLGSWVVWVMPCSQLGFNWAQCNFKARTMTSRHAACVACVACNNNRGGARQAFSTLSIFVPDQKWMKCNATAAAVAVAVAAPVVAVAAAIAAQ